MKETAQGGEEVRAGHPGVSSPHWWARPWSVRGKLIALTVGFLFVFIWALAALSAVALQKQASEVLAKEQFAFATNIAAELDNKLQERLQGLTLVAQHMPADLRAPVLDAYLAQKNVLHLWFAGGVTVIGLDGKAIADHPALPGRQGGYYGDRDYFRQAVATRKPYIDKPILGRVLQRPILTIGVPIFGPAGEVRAVLAGLTDLSAPNFLGVISNRATTGQGEFFIVDRNERVFLAATDTSRTLTALPPVGVNPFLDRLVDGYEGSGESVNSRGIPKLYSGKQVASARWTVIAALPMSIALGPVKTLQAYLIAIAAGMTLLVFLAARWLARRIFARLDGAGRAMAQMTAGQLPLAPLTPGAPDEIGQLIGCFNRLVQGRQRHEAALAESEQRVARLNRIYAVLSGINSTIVRIHERQAMLDAACRLAVETGQFTLAWIGLLTPDSQTLRPVAGCGIDLDSIKDIPVSLGAEVPRGQGTAYEALSSQRAVYCNDITRLPQVGPVRAHALKHGCHSVCALPLVVDGAGIGVMGLYAREADFFDADETRLLDELAADISFALQYIQREERLDYLAYYDALTGLPNQTLFLDRLGQFLNGVKEDSQCVATILFDLDHFTYLNETEGRHVGDAVLKMVAQRLQASVQEPNSLARIGADTFAVAVSGLHHGIEAATVVQEQILDILDRPFDLEGKEVRISAHAGIALFPGDGDSSETLFQSAEAALKEARASGLRSLYYAPEINARTAALLAMERDLRAALEGGEFVVHIQPRVDVVSGEIAGAEALLRWQHPERGLVPPAEFIPLAEETGLIVPIGAWVIDQVCALQAQWQAQGLDIVPVAVNLSAAQFARGDLLPTLLSALTRHHLDAKYLELELTETLVMGDPAESARAMNAFREHGFHLALDDFGTGYSSLAYLQRFPFDFVKIDRAFVRDITSNPGDAAIATAVIAMAHRLNLRVVAEGVENEGQLHYLRQHGCDQIQGYYFSPPIPAPAYAELLRTGQRLAVEADPLGAEAPTLLLVDDEAGILTSLQRTLRREGYRILSAGSAREGLELLATHPVQVIVSDQRMPGMSGSEFLSIVKELYPDTVRIILSSYTDLQAVTDAVNRGAVYKFLTKPWSDDLLKQNIRDAFLRYRPTSHPEEAGLPA